MATTELLADGLLTINQACEFLNVSRGTVYTLMNSGRLAFTRVGADRRIPKRALLELAGDDMHGSAAIAA